MIDSTPTPSGAVVDQGTARAPQPVVEADAGREAKEAREDALTQAGHGTGPVALEGEQVLAGPEDRLDALADGGQVRPAAGLVLARRAHHGGAQLGDGSRELTAGVALVADEQPAAGAAATGQQLEADLTLIAPRIGQGECPGRTVGGGQQVQAQAPEPARVGSAVAVAGELPEGRALGRLAASRALDRGRVDEQQIVAGAGTLRGEVSEQPLDGAGEAAATLEVAGLTGQLREQVAELAPGGAQEAPVTGDAHDRLGHAQRDHLGVGDPPAGVPSCLWQKIVSCAINDRAESVEVGVHRGLQADDANDTVGFGLSALLSLGRLNLVESIIEALAPGIVTTVVKTGITRLAAGLFSPDDVRARLREDVERALRADDKPAPLAWNGEPLRLTFTRVEFCDRADGRPGVRRLDGRTLEIPGADFEEVYRSFLACVRLSELED